MIGDEAFSNNRLTFVNLPNSLKTIGRHAFAQNKFKSVVIPHKVERIGLFAFTSDDPEFEMIKAKVGGDDLKKLESCRRELEELKKTEKQQ